MFYWPSLTFVCLFVCFGVYFLFVGVFRHLAAIWRVCVFVLCFPAMSWWVREFCSSSSNLFRSVFSARKLCSILLRRSSVGLMIPWTVFLYYLVFTGFMLCILNCNKPADFLLLFIKARETSYWTLAMTVTQRCQLTLFHFCRLYSNTIIQQQ